jgi:DNA invertase Pin-like site-specific DNA recombinase
MAQFERDQIKDRTKRGMEECKRRGMNLGRAKLFNDDEAAEIQRDRKSMSAKECAAKWNCSVGTIDKYTKNINAKKAA